MSRTYEAHYIDGALRGWFLISAPNFRRARHDATELLHRLGLLPVAVLRVTLKVGGLQLEETRSPLARVWQ